jgi:predicted RNA-binding protein (TIGR00451 family)
MRVYTASKRDIGAIVDKIGQTWLYKPALDRGEGVRVAEIEEGRRLLIFGSWMAVDLNGTLVPFLGSQELLKEFPTIVVDLGAIPHVIKGANVMRPGILAFEGSFEAEDVVCVKEARYGKFIAVGKAILPKEGALAATRGAVVRNLHYIGDVFWNAAKSIGS